MRARATYAKHSSVSRDEDSEIPVVSIDYFYYGEKDGESTNLQVKGQQVKDDVGDYNTHERTRPVFSQLHVGLFERNRVQQVDSEK